MFEDEENCRVWFYITPVFPSKTFDSKGKIGRLTNQVLTDQISFLSQFCLHS